MSNNLIPYSHGSDTNLSHPNQRRNTSGRVDCPKTRDTILNIKLFNQIHITFPKLKYK
jgi:hypothetical protein